MTSDQLYIVTTSALSAGFDYTHVRLVIHINKPDSLVDFAQKSERTERDEKEAYSVVLLPCRWQPQVADTNQTEKRVLHRYLQGQKCRWTCLSVYLDLESQLQQCVEGEDVVCDVCSSSPIKTAILATAERAQELVLMSHTESAIIQQKRQAAYSELGRYREDLLTVQGMCLLC